VTREIRKKYEGAITPTILTHFNRVFQGLGIPTVSGQEVS